MNFMHMFVQHLHPIEPFSSKVVLDEIIQFVNKIINEICFDFTEAWFSHSYCDE